LPLLQGFPPICRADAHSLILGSMPSRESLRLQQYYAHPRNAFWPIMRALFGLEAGGYSEQAQQLTDHGIAVWDVLRACVREGSLDSAIDDESIVTNDFPTFFGQHPRIRRVYFNGAKAEAVYRRRVLPLLAEPARSLSLQRLPSTSPANAGMSLEQKEKAWSIILE
jgi:hypoxanthine-DNA glycosylase